ncbi:MAG: hypothetical protein JST16_14910, partial [Bdellovibrionales bacterium]|nr:hypothetical protein [Bdellovibrionales bacterium]
MKRILFGGLALMVTLSSMSFAAPPVEVVSPGFETKSGEKRLSEDDLVYTDNIKSDEQLLKDSGRIVFDVTGRSLPKRDGKALYSFHEGDLVKVLKTSADGRWVGVETIMAVRGKGKRKAWIPKNAIKLPEPPKKAE